MSSGIKLQDQALYGSPVMMTPFNEPVGAVFRNKFAHRPTWGVSALRNITTTSGSAAIDEVDGFIQLTTGTDTGSEAELQTIERGQYVPGGMGQAGLGIQVPVMPEADGEFAEWGYFDDENGYGFGIDETGFYVWIIDDSTVTKYYRADWNAEPSESISDDVQDGMVFQVNFTWYGFGSIEWRVSLKQDNGSLRRMEPIHSVVPVGPSIIDPNQPITVRCSNGTGTRDIKVLVGGRQFASTREGVEDNRNVPEVVTHTTTVGTGGAFEPILAVRPKATFRGRPNSTNKTLRIFEIDASDDLEWRWIFDATIGGSPSWAEADGFDAAETTVEFTGPSFTVTNGVPFAKGVVRSGANKGPRSFQTRYAVNFEGGQALALVVRPLSANCEVFATATVAESW